MNRRELESQLQELFEGRLGAEALDDLQRELRASPEARDAYRDYAHLHNALQLRAEGIDLLHVVPMDRVVERRQRRLLRGAGLAAAAVVTLGAAVMSLVLTRTPPPTLTFATGPGTEFSISHDLADGKAARAQVLEPGSRLEVRRGTVELEFASGVRGIVRGPADLTLHRKDLLHLARGVAWFEVPAAAVGFKVSTPAMVVTDLGTEFGILSQPGFPDEVHVFAGKVEALHRHGLKQQELLAAGQARVAGPAGRWQTTPLRRELFLTKLPAAGPAPEVVVKEESSTTQFAYANDVSAVDLIDGMAPVATGWNRNNDADPRELTDGIHGGGYDEVPGDRVQGAWTTVGATAEYRLGAGPAGTGYDITRIQSIADWVNVGFGNQAWTLEVKPVGGDWTTLATVDHEPLDAQPLAGGGATKVTLTGKTGVLARGIEALRFTAGAVAGSVNNAFVWRELDVFGAASSSPSSG